MKRQNLTQHQRLSELLRLLGTDAITIEQFWAQMRQHGLTDADIDKFCRGER
jgi:hypothetical protein